MAHFADWIPFGAFLTGLGGSLHCAAMCGPLCATFARNRRDLLFYQLGRLLSYAVFGAAVGALGQAILGRPERILSFGASATLILFLMYRGITLWTGVPRALHFEFFPARWRTRLHRWAARNSFGVGLLSVTLPCGWLHLQLLAAASTGSAVGGAMTLLLFASGSSTALISAWLVARGRIAPFQWIPRRVGATALILAALFTLSWRWLAIAGATAGTVHACH